MVAHTSHTIITVTLLLSALLIAVLQAPADAQTLAELERELRQTDESIELAREVVAESESERARVLLTNAVQLQQTAWQLFSNCDGNNLRPCRSAAEVTVRARREALHAVQVAREQSSDERLAQQTIDRAQRMLEEALAAVREQQTDDTRAMRLLEQAKSQLERANEQYRERQFSIAVRLANSAMSLTRQALNLDDSTLIDRERIEKQIERTQHLIERSAGAIEESRDTRAQDLLRQAVSLQSKARENYSAGRYIAALALTRQSRQLAQRALGRVVEGPVDADAVASAVDKTDVLIERAESTVRSSGSENAVKLLDKAIERQVSARALLRENELKRALAQTRVARNLAGEAVELAGL